MEREFQVKLSLSYNDWHKLQKIMMQLGITERILIQNLIKLYLDANEVEKDEAKPHFAN